MPMKPTVFAALAKFNRDAIIQMLLLLARKLLTGFIRKMLMYSLGCKSCPE